MLEHGVNRVVDAAAERLPALAVPSRDVAQLHVTAVLEEAAGEQRSPRERQRVDRGEEVGAEPVTQGRPGSGTRIPGGDVVGGVAADFFEDAADVEASVAPGERTDRAGHPLAERLPRR